MRKYLLLCYFILLSLALNAEYFTIANYNVVINVEENGHFDIHEIIDVNFHEERRGIIRSIPYVYSLDGKETKIKIDQVSVKNWKFKSYKERANHLIRIGDADVFINGSQRYEITYRVQGAYIWTDSIPEFYWNVIGHEWDVPINHIEFYINFPESLDISNRDYRIYSGPEGSMENLIYLQRRGNQFIGKSTRDFQKGEGVSLAVRLNAGFIEKSGASKTQSFDLRDDKVAWYKNLWTSNQYSPIGLGGILLLLFYWLRNGRNEKIQRSVPIQFEPPAGYSASELGFFIDNKVDQRDLLALLPEWGEKGYVHISRSINPDLDEEDAFIFERIKDLPIGSPTYQRVFFNGIFENGDIVLLSDLRNKMFSSLSKSHVELVKFVKSKNVYDPYSYKLFHDGWMILVFVLSLFGGIVLFVTTTQYLLGFFLLIFATVCLILHFVSPKLSEQGIRLRKHVLGFKEFLRSPDEKKVMQLLLSDKSYFERMFPYAMAFGLDKSWTDTVSKYQEQSPSWYHDTDSHGIRKSTNMSQFSKQFQAKIIQSAFLSRPASSSSGSGGGFSSGGSSGGGYGGGGGSSW